MHGKTSNERPLLWYLVDSEIAFAVLFFAINFLTGLTGIRNHIYCYFTKRRIFVSLRHYLMNKSTSMLEPYVLKDLSLLRNAQVNLELFFH